MNKSQSKIRNANRSGITLVELLTVVTLMTILTALIIPRIRTVNKDRNIREASRVVAAAFASASNRGVTDGAGGIQIVRNPNFVARTTTGQVQFASTRIYLMKSLPDYTGDGENADVEIGGDENPDNINPDTNQPVIELEVTIDPAPLDEGVIQMNDLIRFGRFPFRITSEPVEEDGVLTFFIDFDDDGDRTTDVNVGSPDFRTGLPAPSGDLDFAVQRRPRRIESSAIDLPAGYIIDLRYSGPLDLGDDPMDGDDFHEGEDLDVETYTKFGLANDPSTIEILFDESGGISSVLYGNTSTLFGNTLFLHIAEYDPGEISAASNALNDASTILSRNESLWVTVNNISGNSNVGYNAPPRLPAADDPDPSNPWIRLIEDSRTLSRTRTTAAQ